MVLHPNPPGETTFLAFTPQRQSVLTQKKQSEPQKSFLNLLSRFTLILKKKLL